MEKEYFLGLDLGTGSLGWAVTDMEYEIIRAHGKALWGVRLFESAKTAEERRGFRTGSENWFENDVKMYGIQTGNELL